MVKSGWVLVSERVLSDNPQEFKAGMHIVLDQKAVLRMQQLAPQATDIYFGHGLETTCLAEFLQGLLPSRVIILRPSTRGT